MRSRSVDRIMLLIGAILMLASSYQLFFQQEFTSQTKVLGELSRTFSVVKVKHALNLDWRDARAGHGVSENELIFTNADANAEISFNDGGVLRIGESSLIRVTSRGEETGLNVERGIIRAKLQGEKPLMVELGGKSFELSGKDAEVQINLKDEKGEIGVISGDLAVTKDGVKEELNQDSLLAITKDSIEKKRVQFKPLEPRRDGIYHTVEDEFPVSFNWSPGEEANLLLSQNSDLSGGQNFSARPGHTLELAPGTYFWKVESEAGSSLMRSFRIERERAPAPVRPVSGDEVTVLSQGETPAELALQWKSDSNLKHKLEWQLGDERVQQRFLQGERAIVSVPQGGQLRWRVRIDEDSRPLAIWSPWQEVSVTKASPPAIPQDLSPAEKEYQTYGDPDEEIQLKWTSNHPVEVELISPDNQREVELVQDETWSFRAKESGAYRYRLRAVDDFGRESEWTAWKQITVTDMSSGIEGGQRIQLKRPDQLVTFDWKSDEGETSIFELAADDKFQEVIVKKELQGSSTGTVIPKTGVYYWRSRQVLPDGKIKLGRPVKVIIEPAPAPEKPQKLPDLEVPIEWKVIEKKTTWRVIDLFIAPAYADEVKGVVRIEVPLKEEAKAVVVRVYRDEAREELVLEKQFSGRVFEWEGARPGTYYWQYAIVDFWDRRSPFSDPALLAVTGEEAKPPERPRLRSPIRAKEVEKKEIEFNWSEAEGAQEYLFQISKTKDFRELIYEKKTTKTSHDVEEFPGGPGLSFWRVIARSKLKLETRSNIGRFTVRPPLEKFIVVDQHAADWKKTWKARASLAWAPSSDSYSFSDGNNKGQIDGRALNGIELKGVLFKERWILGGEVLRQSGEVFEGQSYLFQRLFVDALKNYSFSGGSRLGVGLGLGHTTGQEYTIRSGTVKSTSTADVSYGPVLKSFHPLSPKWEVQTKLLYFLGGIKQIEAGVEALRAYKGSYHLLGGAAFSQRSYEVGEGKQSSVRFTIGIGREFD